MVWGLVDGILAAKTGEATANPPLVPVQPVPFSSQLPPLPPLTSQIMTDAEVNSLVGTYDMGAPQRVRITKYKGKAFVFVPGRGEAELIKIGDGQYTILVQAGVTMSATRDASGIVTELSVRLGSEQIRARRVQ
jgi:hypothetical protein